MLKIEKICSKRRGHFGPAFIGEKRVAGTGFSGVAVPTTRWYEESGIAANDANTVNSTDPDVVLACRCRCSATGGRKPVDAVGDTATWEIPLNARKAASLSYVSLPCISIPLSLPPLFSLPSRELPIHLSPPPLPLYSTFRYIASFAFSSTHCFLLLFLSSMYLTPPKSFSRLIIETMEKQYGK